MRHRATRLLAVACAPVFVVAACGDDDDDAASTTTAPPSDESTTSAPASTLEGSITVFAAASLTDAFEEVGSAFEAANPGTTVEFNFAGSSALREQILGGAPADVFASANTSNMDQVVETGAASDLSLSCIKFLSPWSAMSDSVETTFAM